MRYHHSLLGGLAATVLAAGCVTNPATGARQLILVTERQEIQLGLEADPQISAAYGLYPDSGIQRYVRGLGEQLAATSERPQLPWTFRVVDDPVVNAFALPGGFIYLTRGIMAYFDSEAELASVLGHEIGHVTARHSAQQMTTQQLAQVGLVAGMVLLPSLQDYAGIAGAGLQLVFLRFSRDDEREADDLGLRYMTRGGYDGQEMPGVYEMLQAVSEASGGGRLPGWLSTHPNPEDRAVRIQRQLDTMPPAPEATVGRDEYVRRLDGMVFGANPREGYFQGSEFLHPDLRFRLAFPDGWATANQKQAVLGQSPAEDAMLQLTLSEYATPADAARAFAAQDGTRAGAIRTEKINGLTGASLDFGATTDQGTVAGSATFVAHRGNVYRLLALATEAGWPRYRSALRQSALSFAELTDPTALGVQPLRLDIVPLDRAMTLTAFNQRIPSQVPLDALAPLNRVDPGTTLPAGFLVKRVVGGPLPD
ncbi:MAG: M48 family metalloprotease [Gemmatimonadales bacterium]|jgi:predicted Zn-dependent protease